MTADLDDIAASRARHQLVGAGGLVVALGVLGVWRAFSIRQPSGYTVVGPRIVPIAVSSGLIVLGAVFLGHVVLGHSASLERHVIDVQQTTVARSPLMLVVAMVAYSALLRPLGYVIATSVMLPLAAFLLGSRKPIRDLVYGTVLSVLVMVVFRDLLGIRLPTGVLGDLV